MHLKTALLVIALPLSGLIGGCVSMSGAAPDAKPAAQAHDKAIRKISMAIGHDPASFNITNQQPIDAPTGYNGTQYTVNTRAGKIFQCDILEPSGLGKIVTWGMASGADAMCTDFTNGSKDQGKTNKASCNALLRAAGKC